MTEKNQYDSEKASTWTPTQLASAHNRWRRHQAVTTSPTTIETTSARNTAAHHGWSAYAPGTMAGMVLRNDCHGGVSSRTQPVDCAVYQAVQLPVRPCR